MSIAQTAQDAWAAFARLEAAGDPSAPPLRLCHRRNVATAHHRAWTWGDRVLETLFEDEADREAGDVLDVIEPILETLQEARDLAAALAEALADAAGLGRSAAEGTDDAEAEAPVALGGAPPGAERSSRPQRRAMDCCTASRSEGSHHGLPPYTINSGYRPAPLCPGGSGQPA